VGCLRGARKGFDKAEKEGEKKSKKCGGKEGNSGKEISPVRIPRKRKDMQGTLWGKEDSRRTRKRRLRGILLQRPNISKGQGADLAGGKSEEERRG